MAAVLVLLLLSALAGHTVFCTPRRLLHEPLPPVDGTPGPPVNPGSFFPAVPPPPPPPSPPHQPPIAIAVPAAPSRRPLHNRLVQKVALIGVSVSLAAAVALLFSALGFFLYRRLKGTNEGSGEKLSAGGGDGRRWLAMDASTRRTVFEEQIQIHTSPDLQRMPPLTNPPPIDQPYTPATDEKPSSQISRHRRVDEPRSRRTSPRMPVTSLSSIPPPPPFPTQVHSPLRRKLLRPLPAGDSVPMKLLSNGGESSSSSSSLPVTDGSEESMRKAKLKPLHWDKVGASSIRAMASDQFESTFFPSNGEAFESYFKNLKNQNSQETSRNSVFSPLKNKKEEGGSILDPKKFRNIRAMNVTKEQICEALLDGNSEGLEADLFETLVMMTPTGEEELKLKNFNGDVSKLDSAEQFLKVVLDLPYGFERVDALLYRAKFVTKVDFLQNSYETIEAACEDLRSSRLFRKLLKAVLVACNSMNVGTDRGEANAFKFDNLLYLADVKTADGKTTLLHFVLHEIIRAEASSKQIKEEEFRNPGLKVVSELSNELLNVKKAAAMDTRVLASYVEKLDSGLKKITSFLQVERLLYDQGRKFFDVMKVFLREAELEIDRLKSAETKAIERVRETAEFFHGFSKREETNPLGIFMAARDLLLLLDKFGKDFRKIPETTKTFVGSAALARPVRRTFDRRGRSDSGED